jgi:hypothetical protein
VDLGFGGCEYTVANAKTGPEHPAGKLPDDFGMQAASFI